MRNTQLKIWAVSVLFAPAVSVLFHKTLLRRVSVLSRCRYMSPQAYILLSDAEVSHYVAKPEEFDVATFANFIEERVAVLSIAETWVTDEWDGTCCVSETAESYAALAATLEVVGDETSRYIWSIQQDTNGTACVNWPCPHIRCDSSLFRMRSFRDWRSQDRRGRRLSGSRTNRRSD